MDSLNLVEFILEKGVEWITHVYGVFKFYEYFCVVEYMALRNVIKYGDELLRKKSKKVDVINDRILTLLDDMEETLYKECGVGLAAPQVGVLKRAIVIDIGEGILKLINTDFFK